MAKLQAIRGMNDILPEHSPGWQYLETVFRRVAARFGYQEIRFPVVEYTELFKRSIGAVTDIVEKEMYSFKDRNDESLSLRPEGTAGCVRAADQQGLLYNQQQRLWYQGPMFRYERPQKGRYRQFHQFGVEAFGMPGPDIDVEILQLSVLLWQELDLSEHLKLEINNIGSAADRKRFSAALTAFLETRKEQLDEVAVNRMYSNPMRVLDSKNPAVREALQGAPQLPDYVSEASRAHYRQLQALLRDLGIEFVENPHLVRGLDYYNYCVYEWTTDTLGAQGAVCGGGRYDGLVEQLGGRPTLAAGFAIGQERLVLMLESLDKIPAQCRQPIDLYLLAVGNEVTRQALDLARQIRRQHPQLRVISHCGGGKYDNQLKRAYARGARLAVILERDGDGSEALATAKIRRLDDSGESAQVETASVPAKIAEFLENSDK